MTEAPLPAAPSRGRLATWFGRLKVVIGLLLAFVCLWFGSAIGPYYRIGDDPAFVTPAPIAGGSRTVDMAAALIERET